MARRFYGSAEKTARNNEIIGLWFGQKRLSEEKRLTLEQIGKLYPSEVCPDGISRQAVWSIIKRAKR